MHCCLVALLGVLFVFCVAFTITSAAMGGLYSFLVVLLRAVSLIPALVYASKVYLEKYLIITNK